MTITYFILEELGSAPTNYIPLRYKERAVAFANANPKYSLKSLKRHGFHRLTDKRQLRRWKHDVEIGGNHYDKWYKIDHETYERFLEARRNKEQVK